MKRREIIRRVLRWITLVALVISLAAIIVICFDYVYPGTTDQSFTRFMKSPAYLPVKDGITREEISAPLARLLNEERQDYARIYAWAWGALVSYLLSLMLTIKWAKTKQTEQDSAPNPLPAE